MKNAKSGIKVPLKVVKITAKAKYLDVKARLEKAGFDPIDALINIAQDSCSDEKVKLKAIIALADKSYPSLRAVEHKTDDKQHDAMLDQLREIMSSISDAYKSEY